MRINTNIPSLLAYNALNSTERDMENVVRNISTGLRVNSAADDPSGLTLAEKLRAQRRGMESASSNSKNADSMLKTADYGLGEITSLLQRMRDLSVIAATDTLSYTDRMASQLEMDSLKSEIDRISSSAQFNRKQLLDGSASALWSSGSLSVKAIINGMTKSGEYDIRVSTLKAGRGEVQNSGIFKISGPNVVTNVSLDSSSGFNGVSVKGAPPGQYTVSAAGPISNSNLSLISKFTQTSYTWTNIDLNTSSINIGNLNLNLRLEVVGVDLITSTVKFSADAYALTSGGVFTPYSEEFSITEGAALTSNSGLSGILDGLRIGGVNSGSAARYTVGDVFVLSSVAAGDMEITVSGSADSEWSESWPSGFTYSYGLNDSAKNNDVTFGAFYFDDTRNKTHAGEITVSFGDIAPTSAGASFTVAYPGKTAQAGVRLRDIDAFWDANGGFLLDTPATLTLTQGDGLRTGITIYGTDTLDDVREKLNDAVAYGLNQNRYVNGVGDKFVTFAENGRYGTQEPSAGMFVIRSAIPGAGGMISVGGPESVMRGLSLSVVQSPEENIHGVSIYDAYSGIRITGEKMSGNVLYGAINENVDLRFDGLDAVTAAWMEGSKAFSWTPKAKTYRMPLHISDNRTVFQIGANEGETIATGIGNMSSEALGVSDALVTSKESASRAISKITGALAKVSKERASIGATQNRLEHAINYLATASENFTQAESQIRDADLPHEVMAYAKLRILSRVGSAIFAQANHMPENILSLML